MPPEWGVSQTGNIGQAIITAREKGKVSWEDIKEPIEKYFGYKWTDAACYNTGNNKNRALRYDMKMSDFLRNNWNNVKGGTSPARGYGGILIPESRDANGDIVYKYNGK